MKSILRHCETFCGVVERVGRGGGWERRGGVGGVTQEEESGWVEEVMRIEKVCKIKSNIS